MFKTLEGKKTINRKEFNIRIEDNFLENIISKKIDINLIFHLEIDSL